MFKFFYIFITSLIFLNSALAENVNIFKFTEQELSELDVRKVRGADNKTVYTVGSNENGNFLKAVADNAASGLGKEVKIKHLLLILPGKLRKICKALMRIQKKVMILQLESLL